MLIRPRQVDLRNITLSAEEGFVLSRIEGPVTFRELVSLSGMEMRRLVEVVGQLAEAGAVDVPPEFMAELASSPAPRLSVPAPTPRRALPITFAAATDVGRVRENNEDGLVVFDATMGQVVENAAYAQMEVGPRGVLFMISDGMGGANAGEIASELVLETTCAQLAAQAGEDAAAGLASAVLFAHERVVEGAREPGRTGMGATAVALLVHDGKAYTAEVGDSRAYVLRAAELTQISRDQTQGQLLIDGGLLDAEQVRSSRAKNVVLQAMGHASELVVAQHGLALRSGDRLLLCSDGLTTHVADGEIAEALSGPLDLVCGRLIEMANDRGGKDNISIIVAEVAEPLPPPGPGETVAATLEAIRELSFGQGAP
jgi:serine/threonine protein phosphatase PrpC